MRIKETQFTNSPEFVASEHFVNFTTTVSDTGVVADTEGKKIVKAGSILSAAGVVVNDGTAAGILFADVDVTDGPKPGALMKHGFVLEARLPVAPEATACKPALIDIGIQFK